jgi:hypothetical protein
VSRRRSSLPAPLLDLPNRHPFDWIDAMTRLFRPLLLLLLAGVLALHVTPSAAQAPFPADTGINGGALMASINERTAAQCLARCKDTPGCTGFQFVGGAFGSMNRRALPGASCLLYSGAVGLQPLKGVTACVMPCDGSAPKLAGKPFDPSTMRPIEPAPAAPATQLLRNPLGGPNPNIAAPALRSNVAGMLPGRCGQTFRMPCAQATGPASIALTWAAHPAATHYRVLRGPNELAVVPAAQREYVDNSLNPGVEAGYSVVALRFEGHTSLGAVVVARPEHQVQVPRYATLEASDPVNATTPALATPTGVSAEQMHGAVGRVVVRWAPVPMANGYLVYRNGNPLPVDPAAGQSMRFIDIDVPLGNHSYRVEALHAVANARRTVNGGTSAAAPVTMTFPQPKRLFLSMGHDTGNAAVTQAHYRTHCPALLALSDCRAAEFIRAVSNWEPSWAENMELETCCQWTWNTHRPNWPFAGIYNQSDLGMSRRVNCSQPSGNRIICWVANHPGKGPKYEWHGILPTSLSLIVMYSDGRSFFANFEPAAPLRPDPYRPGLNRSLHSDLKHFINDFDMEHALATQSPPSLGAQLDSQGRKSVPHACLSCHGGRYDPATNLVTGATLLPVLASGEDVRKLNLLIYRSNPAPAVAAQMHALYGGAIDQRHAPINTNAVPAGWRGNEAVYQQVVGPYCANCHFAQRGPLSFATAQDMRSVREAVHRSVCEDFTMPHSEIQFRRFWTEGKQVALPVLLASWLGFDRCGK